MLNLTKQRLSLSLSADSEVLSLNSNSVFADNPIMSYPTCSGISCSADCADRDPCLRKDDVLKEQSGRSMIEMLGVLAIIGVLSVGGIAGYSKAMTKYKINKTVDQISQIVGNVRTMYGGQKAYDGMDSYSNYTVFKKGHLIPDEMWSTDGTTIENAFGGSLRVVWSIKKNASTWDGKAFVLALSDIPEEACMEILTYDWGSGSSSGLIAIGYLDNSQVQSGYFQKESTYVVGCHGSSSYPQYACPNGNQVSVPMPVNVAADACSSADSNNIFLKFY